MKLAVIIATYNQPESLRKVLWGYAHQTQPDFELLIADDGSEESTALVVRQFTSQSPHLSIKHLWQEDAGFRKTQILNTAITAATADYLIFTDGDMIPREDFVEQHQQAAEPGYYVSAGRVNLPPAVAAKIDCQQIISGQAFSARWLKRQGLKAPIKMLKLTRHKKLGKLLNWLTTAKPTFNGCNTSAWKKDLVQANGFDQRMRYGGEDRELGYRLRNAGLKPKQRRFSAVCLHLDHDRPYVNSNDLENNRQILLQTQRSGRSQTPYGLV